MDSKPPRQERSTTAPADQGYPGPVADCLHFKCAFKVLP